MKLTSTSLKILDPQSQIFSVLGTICNEPLRFRQLSNPLEKKDFVTGFHTVVFIAISNLITENPSLKTIKELDIDTYLKPYPKYYAIWDKNRGPEYIHSAKQQSNPDTFNSDYEVVKKYSLLRQYIKSGIDVSDLFDFESGDMEKINAGAKLIESMSLEDILDHYTTKVMDIRNSVNEDSGTIVKFNIDDDIDTLIERLQNTPDLGYPFTNGYYNTLFKGMRGGKFLLRSGDTGTGKTRQAIRDMCNVACSERYESSRAGWVKTGEPMPILFISTELNKDELQVLALAYLSGLESNEIESGNFDPGAIKRLEHAIKVMKQSQMYFVYIEDFSVADISAIIEEYVTNYSIRYVEFDYIQSSPKLSKSLQDAFGHALREDEVIFNLARQLKTLAEKYEIFIMSSTQLNGKAKDDNTSISRDANVIRGSRAVADKIDYGVLTFRATPKDLRELSSITKEGFGQSPNFAHWIYKNRAGQDHIIVWTRFNLANMREEPLFVTDYDYNLVPEIQPHEVEVVKTDDEAESTDKLLF